jgi:hypothetical protein
MQKRVCSFFSLNSEEGLPKCNDLPLFSFEQHSTGISLGCSPDGSEVEQIGKGEVSRKVAQNQPGT